MLSRNSVQVAVAILPVVLLILVEVLPCALQLPQLVLRGEVACLPIAPKLVVPHESTLLTAAQLVDHHLDVLAKAALFSLILTTGIGHRHRRHIVSRSVPLQLCRRRVPAVGHRIALRREAVGVAIVIQLLLDVELEQVVDVQVAVPGQAVVALQPHLVQRQRLGLGLARRYIPGTVSHFDTRHNRIALRRRIVTRDVALHLIFRTYRSHRGISLGLLAH